ncbi:MAG: serine/threonine-protein kinase [Candidatus Eisenbacteria bacterium]
MTAPKGMEGTVIAGRYEIVSPLGTGNFASVWKARQTDLGGDVAVKILEPGYGSDPDLVDDFIAQAKSYVAFRDDPRIATILDCGHDLDTGLNFVAMTLLGQTVESIASTQGALTAERVFKVAEDIGAALRAIHHKGMVHGDIKGTNIMTVPGDDRFVLTDFVVGLPTSPDGTAPTIDMNRLANWAYASPEKIQATSRTDLLPASDLYSLGVVLFRLATGRYPFESRFPQVVHDHLKATPPDPRSIRADIPLGLSQLILKCLEKDPADRFPDADEFLRAVNEARTVAPPPQLFGLPRTWVLIAGASLVALVAFGFLLFWPRGLEVALRTVPENASYRLYEGNAESRFDALRTGETPADLRDLPDGPYTVVVEQSGFFPKTQRFEVAKGMQPVVVVLDEQFELRVASDPSGADATLQALTGERAKYPGGPTPADFSGLRSGPYELVLRLENYATAIETLEVGAGQTEFHALLDPGELLPLAVLSSPPGATVSVDGTVADVPTPCKIKNLSVGTYRIAFEMDGFAPFDTTFALAASPGGDTLFVELGRLDGTPGEMTDSATEFRRAERREEARTEERQEDLRVEVRNHVQRKEWVEADRALRTLVESTGRTSETDAWRSQIDTNLAREAANREQNEEAARKGVRNTLRLYEAALESRNVSAFARLWVSLQPAEREKFERAMTDIVSQSIEITEGSLVLNGNRATLEFHEVRHIQPREGKPIEADRNRTMTLRRMSSGEWLIVSMK